MPTVETWTVGTGGDYATPALAAAALPGSLVAIDTQLDVAFFNQEWTAAGTVMTIPAVTTDATRFIRLIAYDRPDVTDLPLRYNTSAGPCLRATVGYTAAVYCYAAHTKFIDIQIKAPNEGMGLQADADYCVVDRCLVEGHARNIGFGGVRAGLVVKNTVLPRTLDGGGNAITHEIGDIAILNCTIARSTNRTTSGTAIANEYDTDTIKNTVVIGYTNFCVSAPSSAANNAGSMASVPGAGSLASITPTAVFEDPSDASGALDLRTATASPLLEAGADLSGSGVIADYANVARSVPYSIGAWQPGSAPPFDVGQTAGAVGEIYGWPPIIAIGPPSMTNRPN